MKQNGLDAVTVLWESPLTQNLKSCDPNVNSTYLAPYLKIHQVSLIILRVLPIRKTARPNVGSWLSFMQYLVFAQAYGSHFCRYTSMFPRSCEEWYEMGALKATSGSVLHYQPSRKTFLLMAVACSVCCSCVRFEFRSTGVVAIQLSCLKLVIVWRNLVLAVSRSNYMRLYACVAHGSNALIQSN
jgi:hypothetical protein